MRSIFVKIFLWFWLAMILVSGSAVISMHTNFDPDREGIRYIKDNGPDRFPTEAHMAVYIYEKYGVPDLQKFLDRREDSTNFRGYIFDSNGFGVTGQLQPEDAKKAAISAIKEDKVTVLRTTTDEYVAFNVKGNSDNYVFVTCKAIPFLRDGNRKRFVPFHFGFIFEQPSTLIIILAAVILTSGIVCYGLARYVTSPLRHLRDSSCQLALGNLSVRVKPVVSNRHDEIGGLGRDFDFMAEQIESLVSTQQRLLRDISHELRSPLARLNVALGLARQ